VVIGVGVDVEEPRRPGHRLAQSGERRLVAAFREIGHGLERKRHGASIEG
jgi:hypothetical protein